MKAREAAVALTERFVAAMDSEHRELGLGDPSLGKKVRKLVGSLGRRVDLWREALGRRMRLGRGGPGSLFETKLPPMPLPHATLALRHSVAIGWQRRLR